MKNLNQPPKQGRNQPGPLGSVVGYHWPFLVVLAVYFALTFYYSFSVPIWEAPDEPAHFAYTQFIHNNGGPPIQSFEEGKNLVETGHHPPFYYLLGALITLPLNLSDFTKATANPHFSFANTDGGVNRFVHDNQEQSYPNTLAAAHLMRLLSTLFGAGTLILIYMSGLVLFGGKGWEWCLGGRIPALLATAFVGTLPQFNFLSGAANNDNAIIFFCTFSLYLCLRLAILPTVVLEGFPKVKGWLFYGLVGVVTGLGLLSKYNEIVYIPLIGVGLAIAAFKQHSWRYFWKSSFISGGVCIAVAGWWFIRSQILYGDPAGWGMWRSSFHSIEQGDKVSITGDFLAHTWSRWFDSFWGYFGWFNLPLESEIYSWLACLSLVVAFGATGFGLTWLAGFFFRKHLVYQMVIGKIGGGEGYDQRTGNGLLFCVLAIALVVISAFNYAVTFGDAGTQGRYLFPALSPLALLLGGGLVWLVGLTRLVALPALVYKITGWALICLWLICFGWLNIYIVNDVIGPAYQPVLVSRAQAVVNKLPDGSIKAPAKPRFQPAMQLEGYSFEPARQVDLKPGKIKVTLYWRAMNRKPMNDNWVNFTQLVDNKEVFDRNDGPPSNGHYQTFKWLPGELVRDERIFNIQSWQINQLNQNKDTLKVYLAWARSPDWSRATLPDGSNGLTIPWQP